MAGIRQPRAERRQEPQPIRVQERDRFILEALAKMRFLTTSQIAALGFKGSQWAALKRLRKLLDAGFIRVWMTSLNEENIYAVSRQALNLLDSNAAIPRTLDGNLDHLLAINRVRIAFALDLARLDGELVRWRSDWELRTELRSRVIPDALFDVRWADGSLTTFALEVDHHSRSTRGFLKKLLGYMASGTLNHVVLFVGHDPQWVERYRQALARTRLAPQVWFTTFALLESEGLAAGIFTTAGNNERYSLRDLASLPYGKEGRSLDSLDIVEG